MATWGYYDPDHYLTAEALLAAIDSGELQPSGLAKNKINVNHLNALSQWVTGTVNVVGGSVPYPTQIQVGTGTTAPTATDSGLTTPVGGTLKTCSIITQYIVTGNYYGRWVCNYTSADPTFTATEGGLFDVLGNMHSHWLFSPSFSKQTGGAWIDYKIQYTGN